MLDLFDNDEISIDDELYSDDFEVVQHQDARLPQKDLDNLLRWLEPTDYLAESSEFSRHLLSRAPGTGLWLCDTDRYCQWYESSNYGSLWIKGVPGAGKSVLAASLVQRLKETEGEEVPVLFFFFRHIVHANRYPKSLMRDWLAQLLPHSIVLQGTLQPMTKSRLSDVSEDVLWECLLKGLSNLPKAFCVVDAMDEMETAGSAVFFRLLNALSTFRPDAIKLFMTSRPRQDLQSCLSATSIVHISLEEDRVGKEIEGFISYRLQQAIPNRLENRDSLAKAIAIRSRGLFLYARLLVDQLLPGLKGDQNVDINALPLHLEDMYNQMLARQAKELGIDTRVQAVLLGYVTHCARPLRLRELAGFLSYMLSTVPKESSKKIARLACHPLLEILEDETVQVIHHSFSEFLLDGSRLSASRPDLPQFPVLNPQQIHKELAMACLEINTLVVGREDDDSDELTVRWPFSSYAREHWDHHVSYKKDIIDEDLFHRIEEFCEAHHQPNIEPQKRFNFRVFMRYRGTLETPLHVAAYTGLIEYTRKLISQGQDLMFSIHPRGEDSFDLETVQWSESPLGIACQGGHADVLELIWPADALSLIKSQHGRGDMLNSAVSHADPAVLKLLLKGGITPKTCSNLNYMKERLHRVDASSLTLLLPYLTDEEMSYTFCKCASEGRDKALQVILDKTKADTTWRTNKGTALYQACAATEKLAGTVECVKLLLPSFPDINARVPIVSYGQVGKPLPHSQEKRTVLHALAGSWSDDNHDYSTAIFHLLLEAGADIEAQDAFGDTPVLCLFPKSHPRKVLKPLKYLLEAGADMSVPGKEGGGLIHRALELHLDVRLLEVLVEHDADVNALVPVYGTSLPVLATFWDTRYFYRKFFHERDRDRIGPSSRREVAEFLTRHGATIEAGGIPVRVINDALESCDIESFQMLLDTRSAGTCLDECLFSIKYVFSGQRMKGNTRSPLPFIQALVAAGASLETKDKEGSTPLLKSVVEKDVFVAFLQAGADRDAEDPCGRGALHHLLLSNNWSRKSPPVGRLQDLVEMGYDPLKTDNQGNSLLHFAVPICSRDTQMDPRLFPFLQQLIDYGLSTRATNDAGITALHSYFDDSGERRREDPANSTAHLATLLDFLKGTAEGIDINARDDEGITPLHLAVISTSPCAVEYVNVLLNQGADLPILTKEGKNALHLACRARNTATVGYLLDQAADLVNQEDKEGRTPLFDACASGVVESVASLLRAGAKLGVSDKQGWTPLHACAEFVEEHQRWTLNEGPVMAGERMQFDRYRPYMPRLFGRERRLLGYFDPDSRRYSQDQSSFLLENPDLSIYAVVRALLDAGADVSAKGGVMGITPIELAKRLNCHGMIMALQRCGRIPNYTGWCDSNKVTGLSGQRETLTDEVLRNPWSFIGLYDLDDISWLKNHDANLFTTIKADEEGNNASQKPFKRIYSFVESVVLTGLTEVMEHLGGDVAQRDAFPDNPIDKWTLETVSRSKGSPIPSSSGYSCRSDDLWDPESIKTIGDFLRPTTWEINPVLHLACQRTCPNMEMLRVLLEKCGVDVNAPSARYKRGEVVETTTTLHFLASKQALWHLEAIHYLVSKGANIHAKDFEGKTPLHHACASSRVWAPRFVQLLLELGADPTVVDKDERTCMDVAKSAEVLRVFSANGLNLADHMNLDLFLAIGKLNLDMVRMTLDAGADVNHMEETPTYTVEELEWEMHDSPIKDDTEAVPLVGALLYEDYTQVAHSPEGRDLRADIVRLLIERGADLLALWMGKPVLHAVFEDVMCERKYLEIFFEYPDLVDFNARDDKGRTVFLAACNAGQKWEPWIWEKDNDDSDKGEADEGEDDGNDAHEAEDKWDSTGLFLRMMDFEAEVTAIDNDGNNALVSALKSPS
jgi:ankyrin repeat protein